MSRAKEYHAAVLRIRSSSVFGLLAGLGAAYLGFQGDTWLSGAFAVGGAGALTMPPTPEQEEADRLDAVVDDVRSSTMATDPAHVRFETADIFSRLAWDGRLRATDAVFASKNGSRGINPMFTPPRRFVVVPKEDVEITAGHKKLFRSSRNATFRFGDRRMRGTILPDALDRYIRWKQSS